MPICRNCGVEIDAKLERCPLCLTPPGLEEQAGTGASPPPAGDGPPIKDSRPFTLLLLWEIVSLLAGTSMVVVFVADFAYSMTVTWSRYPVVSIAFIWAAGSLLLLLRRHRYLLMVAQTAALAIFLLALDLLTPTQPWFLSLALPLAVLAGGLTVGVSLFSRLLRHRVFAILAVALVGNGVFLAALETVIRLHLAEAFRLSWSLLVFGCSVPLVGLLFYVQYRLKVTSDDLRKVFHL
jgi:hypothetical protein